MSIIVLDSNNTINVNNMSWPHEFHIEVGTTKISDDIYMAPQDDIKHNNFYHTQVSNTITIKNIIPVILDYLNPDDLSKTLGFWIDYSFSDKSKMIDDFTNQELEIITFGDLLHIYWSYDVNENKFKVRMNNSKPVDLIWYMSNRLGFMFLIHKLINNIIPNNNLVTGGFKDMRFLFLVPLDIIKGNDIIFNYTNNGNWGPYDITDVNGYSNLSNISSPCNTETLRVIYNNEHPVNCPYKAFEFK